MEGEKWKRKKKKKEVPSAVKTYLSQTHSS